MDPIYDIDLFYLMRDVARMVLRQKHLDNWSQAGQKLMEFCELVAESKDEPEDE